jgi:ankyrin repeat protein
VLLEHGADINKAQNDGCTPLHMASQQGHVDVVRVLLEQGADINKAKNNGCTPLFMASQDGHVDVVRVLLEQGADITKTWDNKTPLQIAREENHPEIIHLLELAAQA